MRSTFHPHPAPGRARAHWAEDRADTAGDLPQWLAFCEEAEADGRHLERVVAPAVGAATATQGNITTSECAEQGKEGEPADPGDRDGAHRVQPQQRQIPMTNRTRHDQRAHQLGNESHDVDLTPC